MSKSKKGTAPQAVAVTAEVTGPVAFANGIDAGESLAGIGFMAADIAARMRVTVGAAYSSVAGFPTWRDLEAALEKAGVSKVTKSDLAKGMAKKWDAMYLSGAAVKSDVDVERKRELVRIVGFNAFDFMHLSPQAKAALGKDNAPRAAAVKEFGTMLNKNASNTWGDLVRIDNRVHGRSVNRGADKKKSVADLIKKSTVEGLAKRVASLVEDGFEVPAEVKAFAAYTVKAKWAVLPKK